MSTMSDMYIDDEVARVGDMKTPSISDQHTI